MKLYMRVYRQKNKKIPAQPPTKEIEQVLSPLLEGVSNE